LLEQQHKKEKRSCVGVLIFIGQKNEGKCEAVFSGKRVLVQPTPSIRKILRFKDAAFRRVMEFNMYSS
jgi:hypothetical protein